MNGTKSMHAALITLGLAALMALTRYGHFSSALSLADASLGVFFLGGLYLRRWMVFPIFPVLAGTIDFLAITAEGTSGWCVTPAYGFLIPAYGSLWYGGRWCAGRQGTAWAALGSELRALFIAVSLAFLISNGGFYLFSGYFQDLSLSEYGLRVAKYLPPYLGSAFLYVAPIALMRALRRAFRMNVRLAN
ncbi:MAG: hypothetical protein ACREX9_21490 [Gammaproteobacteria bacterium]